MEENKKPVNPFAFASVCESHIQEGMTLRDYFAGLAMQGLLSSYHGAGDAYLTINNNADKIAKNVYKLADEMLKQREK